MQKNQAGKKIYLPKFEFPATSGKEFIIVSAIFEGLMHFK
jgi:hypothetical protein